MVGSLATPFMIERVVWLLRRSPDVALLAVAGARPEIRDLVLWDLLLGEHSVPAATLRPADLRLLAFSLAGAGRREVDVPDSPEWQAAVALAAGARVRLARSGPSPAEIRSYVDGGFLDDGSSRQLPRFASPDIQATLAAGLLAAQPELVTELGRS
jgi:hypothetical protein